MPVFRKLVKFFSKSAPPPIPTDLPEVAVSDTLFNNYSFVIGSVFSYFNHLSPENKRRFVHRVHQFKERKKFHFVGMEEKNDMATLISSSAIQVTFGLENYQLSHFEN